MKKSLIFLLSLVLISSILSAAQLPLTEFDGDFNLYDRYGNRIDVMDVGPYAEEGYIILTEKGASFTCPYGEIHLGEGTLFTILSLDEEAPVLYLVDGKADFISYDDFYLEVYTPVSLVAFDKKGEYIVETTADAENIYNLSTGRMVVLNGLTGNQNVLDSLTYIMMLDDGRISPVSYQLYQDISILKDNEPAHVPSAPSLTAVSELVDSTPATPAKPVISVSKELVKTEPDKPEISVTAEIVEIAVPAAPDLSVSYKTPEKPVLEVSLQTVVVPDVPESPSVTATFQTVVDTTPAAPSFLKAEGKLVNTLQAPTVMVNSTSLAANVSSSSEIEKKTR